MLSCWLKFKGLRSDIPDKEVWATDRTTKLYEVFKLIAEENVTLVQIDNERSFAHRCIRMLDWSFVSNTRYGLLDMKQRLFDIISQLIMSIGPTSPDTLDYIQRILNSYFDELVNLTDWCLHYLQGELGVRVQLMINYIRTEVFPSFDTSRLNTIVDRFVKIYHFLDQDARALYLEGFGKFNNGQVSNVILWLIGDSLKQLLECQLGSVDIVYTHIMVNCRSHPFEMFKASGFNMDLAIANQNHPFSNKSPDDRKKSADERLGTFLATREGVELANYGEKRAPEVKALQATLSQRLAKFREDTLKRKEAARRAGAKPVAAKPVASAKSTPAPLKKSTTAPVESTPAKSTPAAAAATAVDPGDEEKWQVVENVRRDQGRYGFENIKADGNCFYSSVLLSVGGDNTIKLRYKLADTLIKDKEWLRALGEEEVTKALEDLQKEGAWADGAGQHAVQTTFQRPLVVLRQVHRPAKLNDQTPIRILRNDTSKDLSMTKGLENTLVLEANKVTVNAMSNDVDVLRGEPIVVIWSNKNHYDAVVINPSIRSVLESRIPDWIQTGEFVTTSRPIAASEVAKVKGKLIGGYSTLREAVYQKRMEIGLQGTSNHHDLEKACQAVIAIIENGRYSPNLQDRLEEPEVAEHVNKGYPDGPIYILKNAGTYFSIYPIVVHDEPATSATPAVKATPTVKATPVPTTPSAPAVPAVTLTEVLQRRPDFGAGEYKRRFFKTGIAETNMNTDANLVYSMLDLKREFVPSVSDPDLGKIVDAHRGEFWIPQENKDTGLSFIQAWHWPVILAMEEHLKHLFIIVELIGTRYTYYPIRRGFQQHQGWELDSRTVFLEKRGNKYYRYEWVTRPDEKPVPAEEQFRRHIEVFQGWSII